MSQTEVEKKQVKFNSTVIVFDEENGVERAEKLQKIPRIKKMSKKQVTLELL